MEDWNNTLNHLDLTDSHKTQKPGLQVPEEYLLYFLIFNVSMCLCLCVI